MTSQTLKITLQDLPTDLLKKINIHLLDKKDKRFNKIFNNSKDYKLLKVIFDDNIPTLKQLQYIEPNIFNEYKSKINLDCIKEYINTNCNGIIANSFQIIYKVNSIIGLTSFNIRVLDENNIKIGSISSSYRVSYKYKNKDREYFLCNEECQNVINNMNKEIKEYIQTYKNG